MKTFREAEKEQISELEVNHNFEADLYLEKLEQDNEKVIEIHPKFILLYKFCEKNIFPRKSRDQTAMTYWTRISDLVVQPNSLIRIKC